MAELILPGTYIEVRPEGLMLPRGVTVSNLGVIGTASKGPIKKPVTLGSFADAKEKFGDFDPWIDGKSDELTLVRALELAFRFGATSVRAVRVASNTAQAAEHTLKSSTGDCVKITALSDGTWGNELAVNVAAAEDHAFVEDEAVDLRASTVKLAHAPVVASARNRLVVKPGGGGVPQTLQILYSGTPVAGQVLIDVTKRNLTFGANPDASDAVLADYMVDKSQAMKVTLRYRGAEEVYTVVSGDDLFRDLKDSVWVKAEKLASSGELPKKTVPTGEFHQLVGGANGAAGANYQDGLDMLLNEDAHILVAAGQDQSFSDELAAHCQIASSDDVKRDRIAVVGSSKLQSSYLDDLRKHTLASDRLIFVTPGIKVTDTAAIPPVEVTLPGAYAAAAVAGLMAGFSPHVSLTNKVLQVGGLEKKFTRAELKQLLLSRVLVLEERQGFRIAKGITTSTNTAWEQITTRRIVDYAKFGVRAAANPFIGRLNNTRVRGALRTAINSFLADMVTDEMLISYELEVTATREQEVRGIVQVTMVLRPAFSIDFIKVTMFLD